MTVWRRNGKAMNDRISGLLGIARRSGHLQCGFDATVDAVTAGQAKLVLCAADISPKTDKEWRYAVRRTPVRALTLPLTKEQLGHALGLHRPVGLAVTDDDGFAARLTALTTEQPEEETTYDD